jgi:hypothetical protein
MQKLRARRGRVGETSAIWRTRWTKRYTRISFSLVMYHGRIRQSHFCRKVKKSKRNDVDDEKPGFKKPRGGGTSAALALLASGEVVVGRG